MLSTLLAKDLRRAWRNPWPYIINLALPICITALIGLAMGGCSKTQSLARIKVAVVDEDDSIFSSLLRGAMNQGEAKKYLDLRFVAREDALRQIHANQISAVLVIPRGFSRDYLSGKEPAALELIKNPAQSFYPAIIEELLGAGVTALNAIGRNLGADLAQWRDIFESEKTPPDMKAVAKLVERVGDRFQAAKEYLFPPLITYSKETRQKPGKAHEATNIFAYLLPGLAAMFLLFLADHSVRDLYRELQAHTFDRFRTLHIRLLPLIASKIVLAMAILLISSAILFVFGGLLFQLDWSRPLPLLALIVTYSLCAAGLMALIAALTKTERRADVLNSAIILGFAFVGGSMFPARQLPPFFANYVSPLLPNYWFIEAVRALESSSGDQWVLATTKLALLGLILIVAATWLFEQALAKGAR
jgi:ABC-2 type transport system permease protein